MKKSDSLLPASLTNQDRWSETREGGRVETAQKKERVSPLGMGRVGGREGHCEGTYSGDRRTERPGRGEGQ